jgi:hypothetical protein
MNNNNPTPSAYQINKTLRFGLTLNNEAIEKKDQKADSHILLKGSIINSFDSIQEQCKSTKPWNEKEIVTQIRSAVETIKCFQSQWGKIYTRYDQLAVTKEFYQTLTKKARFDGFWINQKGVKQPQSIEIKLSSLNGKYQNLSRYQYIVHYWQNNLNSQKSLLQKFEVLLEQYEKALSIKTQNHTKPNLTNFSKLFLSLTSLVNEILVPLSNQSIRFPTLERLKDNDQHMQTFATENWRALANKLKELKEYLNENGGYIPFGRVTLNQYTAKQKPHDFQADIKDLIKGLKLIELVEELQEKTVVEISQYFNNLDKRSIFDNDNESPIIRAQCFKYKPIPIIAKIHLTQYLSKNMGIDENKVSEILDAIGKSRSIAKDYADFPENQKDSIDLTHYPLKVAFNYAWESLAKSKYNEIHFPKQKCAKFLEKFYNITDIENEPNFQLYADLLYIADNLAILEHSKPTNPQTHIDNIKNIFHKINDTLPTQQIPNKKTILSAIQLTPDNSLKDNSKFQTAKMNLGRFRGALKPKKFTNQFKCIALTFGKKFADLRDKFLESNELNKISYFGVVIEDSEQERYLLLNPMTKKIDGEKENLSEEEKQKERKDAVELITNAITSQGEIKAYQVKSLTSKALQKIISNIKTYPDFHQNRKIIKQKFTKTFKDERDDLNALKDALQSSTMAQNQQWQEYDWNFNQCNTYAEIEKEIDQKGHILKQGLISVEKLENLLSQGCLLLPIVNQDITSQSRENKNQFSKDWTDLFNPQKSSYRLHPEFKIAYRTPTPDSDYPTHKRFGRLQLIASFNCEIISQQQNYLSRKEQVALFNDQDKEKTYIEDFNKQLSITSTSDYKVIGIDRGIKQLATLCVLNSDGSINNDGFEIYKKEFDSNKKQWQHNFKEKRYILDLSNLRVETTVDNNKVLVDQSLTLVKENRNEPNLQATKENRQKIKLKQLAYIRKLQYAMQTRESDILNLKIPDELNDKLFQSGVECSSNEGDLIQDFKDNIKNIGISPYGEGTAYADLPLERFKEIIESFKSIIENQEFSTIQKDAEKRKIIELDHADDLKRGIVANIVGVVNFILEKYNYKIYLSLENLRRAWGGSTDGLDGRYLPSTNQESNIEFKEQQNLKLAGLGTYQFFEMQLLNKLWKGQQEKNTQLIPPFRSKNNYEDITKLTKQDGSEYVYKPFGIVHFIDPSYTSQKCPMCGTTSKKIFSRNHKDNSITCNKDKQTDLGKKGCGYKSNELKEDALNKHFILSGDDNGAYHIALKTLKNLNGTLPSD